MKPSTCVQLQHNPKYLTLFGYFCKIYRTSIKDVLIRKCLYIYQRIKKNRAWLQILSRYNIEFPWEICSDKVGSARNGSERVLSVKIKLYIFRIFIIELIASDFFFKNVELKHVFHVAWVGKVQYIGH